ncbi:MAG TPA: GyrI-like domain-containing protein [Gemmatimonadaceae bacterium]|nr:GyrI-like domain-containing protein [Gemmatimonadaceae bacterium]
MIDTPHITETVAQPVARIHLLVTREEMQHVIGPGIGEIMSVLSAQGIAPAGPWLTHHRRRPTDTFDFHICVPVSAPVTASGRVEPGELPAASVARTVHHGDYTGLAAAWGELMAWLETQGVRPADDLWEVYRVGPESGGAPSTWCTELNRPLLPA